jgi:[ribosomal protein S18]-alanine N-acetyltransferase
MKMRVVPMKEKYLDRILVIEKASFGDPWPPTAFLSELQHPWSWFRVAGKPDGASGVEEPHGFIICWMLPSDMHLLNLAVLPEQRRNGIGGLLLQGALDAFAEAGGGLVSLEVRPSNHAAQQMYHSFGFKVVGRRPGYYRRDHEDAIVMARRIKNTAKTGAKATGMRS